MAFLYSSSDAVTFFAPPKASGAVVGGALTVDPVDAEPSQPGSADRTNATTANELKNQFRFINRVPRKVDTYKKNGSDSSKPPPLHLTS